MSFHVLAINLGSTSTKIAIFLDNKPMLIDTIIHPYEVLLSLNSIWDQKK